MNERRDAFKSRPKKIALAMGTSGAKGIAGPTGQFRALHSMGLLKKVQWRFVGTGDLEDRMMSDVFLRVEVSPQCYRVKVDCSGQWQPPRAVRNY